MVANRANLGSILADNDVAAVSALPDSIAILREYFLLVYIAKQLAVTLFVSLFDCANHAEFSGNLLEAFLVSFLRHAVVHVSPLEIFACCGSLEIACGILDVTALEVLEPQFSVFFSFLAVSSKMSAICSKPSFLAFEAK